MDIQMPVMNGYEATEAIRALDGAYYKKIPIIAMSREIERLDKALRENEELRKQYTDAVESLLATVKCEVSLRFL